MKRIIQKEVVPMDSGTITGELFYGYTNKEEVLNVIMEIDGLVPDSDFLYKVMVFKIKKDGEDWYYFGGCCPTCNRKTKGVASYFYGEL